MRHRRWRRERERFERDAGRRQPRERFLIVTEGSVTEINYLDELMDHLRLSRANIDVHCGRKPRPDSVLQFAEETFEQAGGADEYAAVFCVFDRDEHDSYQRTLDRIESIPGGIFAAVPSAPCFEYWLLLHFAKTAKPYSAAAKSACEQVEDDLRRHLPEYQKHMPGIKYRPLMQRLETALSNSREISQQEVGGKNRSSTRMHELVERLRKMANG